jgi:hypothetical protein
MGHTSTAIPFSRHSCINLGCFTIEKLPRIHREPKKKTHINMIPLPVTYAFRPKEQGIVQVIVSLPSIGKRFPCVEKERQIQPKFFDTLLKCQKWFDIVNQRPPFVFISNDIEPGDQVRKLLL